MVPGYITLERVNKHHECLMKAMSLLPRKMNTQANKILPTILGLVNPCIPSIDFQGVRGFPDQMGFRIRHISESWPSHFQGMYLNFTFLILRSLFYKFKVVINHIVIVRTN